MTEQPCKGLEARDHAVEPLSIRETRLWMGRDIGGVHPYHESLSMSLIHYCLGLSTVFPTFASDESYPTETGSLSSCGIIENQTNKVYVLYPIDHQHLQNIKTVQETLAIPNENNYEPETILSLKVLTIELNWYLNPQ